MFVIQIVKRIFRLLRTPLYRWENDDWGLMLGLALIILLIINIVNFLGAVDSSEPVDVGPGNGILFGNPTPETNFLEGFNGMQSAESPTITPLDLSP